MPLAGRHSLALAAPALLLLWLVVALPELWALGASFYRLRLGGEPIFAGWRNYANLLGDPRVLEAFVRTFLYVAITVAVEVAIAVPAALLMAQRFPLQGFWLALIVAPYAVSNVVGVSIWRNLLASDTGAINNLLAAVGFARVNWLAEPHLAQFSVIVVSVWRDLPFVFMIAYAALLSVPRELREAARIDGASAWQAFWRVVLPIIAPALLVAIVFRIVFAFRQFDVVWLLTQGGPGRATELLSVVLYRAGFRYFNIGEASALAWLMTIGTLIVAFHAMRRMYAAMWRRETGA